ncbi:hypothetical protein EMCRGX_G019952 [Ephydatia muelleri]
MTEKRQRSFVNQLQEQGSAAAIRNKVSAAFRDSVNIVDGGASLVPEMIANPSGVVPSLLDTQLSRFLEENAALLQNDPQRDLVLFPEDDISVPTLPRKFRTVEIPVPGPARRSDDPLVRDCVKSFIQDWTIVKRKFGSFHGHSEEFLTQHFSTCKRTSSYSKLLPRHHYEIDTPPQENLDTASAEDKKRYRMSVSSNVDYNLVEAESDKLLSDLLQVKDEAELDRENQAGRAMDRYPSLFGLYPLPDRRDLKENRAAAAPPSEHQGVRLLVKVSELKFDLSVEPVFAVMALYDARERKKISESFHLDCNPSELLKMVDDNHSSQERTMASLSRSAIFNVSYPNPDVYLVIKVEKVLQQGDISDVADPYIRVKDLDAKAQEKVRQNAKFFCQRLGQYRMPFAWVAINVLDIIAGSQSNSASGGSSAQAPPPPPTSEAPQAQEKRGTTPEPMKKLRSGSLVGARGGENTAPAEETRDAPMGMQLSQNFRPVTLTVNVFFKQESDKLSEEDMFRFLLEMKKPAAVLSRKFKSIPGNLKIDISAPFENLQCCLTSNLWEVDPFPDNKSRRPNREIEEFPPQPVYHPATTYKNFLYVYPVNLDFKAGKGRNIGIRILFMSGEEKEDACCAIYGRSSGPSFLREAWSSVLYHNRTPEYYDEIKIELPPKLTHKHHLLFMFYQISCHKPKEREPAMMDPEFVGCTWIPMLGRDNDIQLGEFNLAITSEHPPSAYSQVPSEVALPNLKWIDGHKPLFKVSLSLASSIHPQDPHLSEFFNKYYQLHTSMGTEQEEKALRLSITGLTQARPNQMVHFLHIVLNNLCSLLVRPVIAEEAAEIPSATFQALASFIDLIHRLDLPTDKHCRNEILCSYVQYVFSGPVGQLPLNAFENRTATMTRSSRPGSVVDDEGMRRTGSLRLSGSHLRQTSVPNSPTIASTEPEIPPNLGGVKVFHEELALQWIVCHPSIRISVYRNAWFFFEVMIKGMAQHLQTTGKLSAKRTERFPVKFLNDLDTLMANIAVEITEKHIQDVEYSRRLNTSLAFFIHDAFSLMDRGFVFSLIRNYLKKFSLATKDFNLTEFRLDFYRIICSHEHYISLNLPLGPILYPPSPHSSPSGSLNSSFESLRETPNIEAMGELSSEFRSYHYLTGLVLTELWVVLEGKSLKLKDQAVEVVRDLIASHDSDNRFQGSEAHARISSIYLPVLSIVMDYYPQLYKGPDGWDDWTATFEKNSEVRRSVIIKESADVFEVVNPEDLQEGGSSECVLGPGTTRNLLICFIWVLKNIDRPLFYQWLTVLSISRLTTLLNVLDLCVSCFEYKGKKTTGTTVNALGTAIAKGPGDIKAQIANAILGSGTARMRLQERRRATQPTSSMERDRGAEVHRWGKTYWQATAESTDLPKVDAEADAQIEGSLAAEASLVVLDTLELLMQGAHLNDNMHTLLARALEVLLRLLACNQSTQVMRNIFATQRAIVWKFPELLFEEETEQCAELCNCLLRHCSSSVPDIRAWATASLYLLMRHNYEIGNTFARVKVQVTVALSSIVAGTSTTFNEHHLRRSLKTLIIYAEEDKLMADSPFPSQVRELALNLHRILLDTVKMQEFKDDPEMLMDLMHRIAKGYQNSPDLRLNWLQHMAEKHSSRSNSTEAAMCLVHGAAVVAEYLYLLEGQPYLPVGCVAFQKLSANVLEESAISEDSCTPEEEGICTSKLFTEKGMIGLLEQAASLFKLAHLYEAVNEVYKLVIPILEAKRAHQEIENIHKKLSDCYKEMVVRGEKRFICSFFRVGFYGMIFGDIDGEEFIYKEAALMRLADFSLKLQKQYTDKFGDDVELLKDSRDVEHHSLNPSKGYIQVTYVEPYIEDWEMKRRITVFDKTFNLRRFVFSTPYTASGKAHGELDAQYIRKTILTTQDSFPYVKKRSKIIQVERIELTPLEVAILNMQEKTKSLRHAVQQDPPDTKLLQMQLQGGIATAVNQGPFAVAQCFLFGPNTDTVLHRKLKVCFKDFTRRCEEALDLNKTLILDEQRDYQKELQKNFKDFKEKLEPMVSTKRKHRRPRDRALINISTVRQSKAYASNPPM